jgi:hypothetical protein
MLRFDGDVFLLGTAISAHLDLGSKKLATFRDQLIGLPRGGGRIVANECAL